jgi:HAD superfamily hydrolase (TIGR01509 family)
VIEAVIFDLDGVLIDSEHVWDEVRQQLAEDRRGRWTDSASRDMMGMSSPEWSRYMRDVIGLDESPDEISAETVRRLEERYRVEIPLIPGAEQAVERLAARWPLGLASSSNRELIDLVLETSGLGGFFQATVSSEEVARGKPSPDVYLEAARLLGVQPTRCAAVEDSEKGIHSAKAACMRTIAIPNPQYPPADDALEAADVVLATVEDLAPAVVDPDASPTAS